LMVAVENGFFDLADQLAKQGANVNLDSSAGQDVFVTAINKGNVPFVDQMICSAGTRTLSFAEATLFAAYHGNEEKIPTPEEYSQINSPQLEGPLVSALLVATDRCHNRVLTRIVDIITGCYPSDRIQSILDHADQTGRTALHRAAAQRRPLVVTYLLSKGASPDWPSNLTAWAEVVRVQDNDEVLSVLNKWGADPNTKDFEGVSVLYQAAASGNLTVVKRCLNAGTDPNIQTIYKWAPLVCFWIYSR
jgi:ankyrin repeat protein